MLTRDRPRFSGLITDLAALFRREVNEQIVEGYWVVLSEYPIEWVENAVTACLGTYKFMPVPVEIKERISVDAKRLMPQGQPALEAGGDADRAESRRLIAAWLEENRNRKGVLKC